MTVAHGEEHVAPPLQFRMKPMPMEFWVSRFTLDHLIRLIQIANPRLREVAYHLLHEFIGRRYNKVKDQMEKGTRDEDDPAKNVEEPMVCGICSEECRQTEERAYLNCGHTYHMKCMRPVWKTKTRNNCLTCGQELFCYHYVAEGESITW